MMQKSQHTFTVTANLEDVQKIMRMHGVTEVSELFQRLLFFENQRAKFQRKSGDKKLGLVK